MFTLSIILLFLVHTLGVLNSMYMWPQCIIDDDGNHMEVGQERDIVQNLMYVYFWEIGVISIIIEDVKLRIQS